MKASMKKMRTALLLLVVLIAMGGLATWDDWQTKKDKEVEKSKNHLADFKPEDVTAVDYYSRPLTGAEAPDAPGTDANGPNPGEVAKVAAVPSNEPVALVLTKSETAWKISQPLAVDADANMVKNLVTTVTDYAYASVVAETKDKWAEFGLQDPSRRITFKFGGSAPGEFTVFIGKKAPVGYSVYLRTSKDDRVYIGSQHLLMSTTKSLGDLRDKTVVRLEEKAVKSLIYTARNQPAIELVKGAEGKYAIQRPEVLEADGPEVRDFFDGLNQLRADAFIDAPTAAETAAFASPDYKITWTDDKGVETTLAALDKGTSLEVALAPFTRAFVVGDQSRVKLKKELLNFRNRRILAINSTDLTRVAVDGETFQNVNGSWYLPADAAKLDDKGQLKAGEKVKPAERAHVRAFAVDLEFARADQFLNPTDPALADLPPAPEHRITLMFKDVAKAPDIVLDVFALAAQPDKFFVRRTGSAQIFRVAKSTFNSMKPSAGGGKEDDTNSAADGTPDLEGLSKAIESSKSAMPKPPKG